MNYTQELFKSLTRFFHIHKKTISIVIISIFLLHNIVFAYNNLQNKTPIIGLRFENHFLFGMKHADIEKLVQKEVLLHNKPLLFVNKDQTIAISQEEVGYKVSPGYLANTLLLKGRTGTILQKFLIQEGTLLGLLNEPIRGTISESLLTLKIISLQAEIDTNPQPVSPDFIHNINSIIPAKDGEKIQVDKLSLLIRKYISSPRSKPLPLPLYIAYGNRYNPDELDPIKKQAISLLNQAISITSGGLTFTLTPDDLKQMANVVERPDPKNAKKTKLSLRLDDIKLNQRLGEFAGKVENITHAEFDDHEARVALYAQFYNPQNPRFIAIPTGNRLLNSHVLGTTDHPGPKIAYLTFDDGPNSLYHPMIVDILHSYNIKATFFLVGKNIPTAYQAAIATVKDGHLIGNHSFTHSFLPSLGTTSVLDELQRTDNILQSITKQPITLFRPPYGGINQYIINDAHQLGLKVFLWDVDPRDWSEPATDELVRRVVSATHDGSNILLHSNHLATVKALPRIIETLQLEGYTFKTLDQYPQQEQL